MKALSFVIFFISVSAFSQNLLNAERATNFYEKGDYLNALLYYNKLDSGFLTCDVWGAKAVCWANIDSFDEAKRHAESAKYWELIQEHCEKDLDSYIGLTDSYFKMGEYEKVHKVGLEGLTKFENSSDLLFNMGVAYYQMGFYETAITALDGCIESDDQFDNAYYILYRIYYEVDELEMALHNIEKAVRLSPLTVTYLEEQGRVYFALENYEQALETLNLTISIDSKSFIGYGLRALTYNRLDRTQEACEDMEIVDELYPGHNLREEIVCP